MTQEPEENASHSEGQEPSNASNPDDPTQAHPSVPEEQPVVPVHHSSSDHETDPKREAEEEAEEEGGWAFAACFGLLFVQSVLFKLSLDVLLPAVE